MPNTAKLHPNPSLELVSRALGEINIAPRYFFLTRLDKHFSVLNPDREKNCLLITFHIISLEIN